MNISRRFWRYTRFLSYPWVFIAKLTLVDMKVLVIGSGGREHAITWALANSPLNPEIFIAPGNPGTAALGINVAIPSSDIDALLAFAKNEDVDLTVVGPEQPLVDGIADLFQAAGRKVFGPSAAAAALEGSKAFAKDFMRRHGIPTADYKTFTASEYQEAVAYVNQLDGPCVLKASGLAAGKGVLMCNDKTTALTGLDQILVDSRFGDAGASVVIEEMMSGEEASLFVLTDGERFVVLSPAQDHKRIGDGDTGPNTGGMGAYAPAPLMTADLIRETLELVVRPTLRGMAQEGNPYTGVLYCGLMITEDGPKVVEFNCRFGDPEAQVVIPLLHNDLLQLILDLMAGREQEIKSRDGAAACVVMASDGYPGSYEKGKVITGIEDAEENEGVVVFQAGTRNQGERLVTSGGRVLAVSAQAATLAEALENAYRGIASIQFEGCQFRRDIGRKGLARLAGS